MNKKTFILLFLTIICLSFTAAAEEEVNWDGKSYDELKERLLEWRTTSPEKALDLSLYLIKNFPDKEDPYGIAFSLYSLKKEFPEAENILQNAIQNLKPNEDYYIKLAHFYRRVNPAKLTSFIDAFKENEKKREDYDLLLAKFHIINQENDKAVTSLKEAVSKGNRSIPTIKLLSSLLEKTGQKDELWQLLNTYTIKPENDPDKKIEFFQTLLASSFDYSREDLVKITNLLLSLVASIDDYPLLKKTINDTTSALISRGKAKELGDVLEKEFLPRGNDESLWIYLEFLQQTGEYGRYFNLMKKYDGKYLFLLEEKARLLEQDGDTTSAALLLGILANSRPEDKRILITLAQFYNRHEKKKESQAILDRISMGDLEEQLLFLYGALCFENLAELRRFRVLVEKWIEAGRLFENQHLATFIKGILGSLPETPDHLALMTIVDEYLTTGTESESPLLLFKINLAQETREFDLYFELADRFLSIQKIFDSNLVYPYVQEAMKRGMRWIPMGDNHPPKIEITNERYIAFAEKRLLQLIEKNSLIPQYHVDLIYIRKAQNREREILDRIDILARDMKNDPERVHLTAYVLATSGFAEKALPYYEKAIRLKPDMARYKMNYGGCLIRARLYQKAIAVYKDVITGGYTTRAWNLHEVLRQIWYCCDQMQKPGEFFRLLEEIKSRKDIPPQDIYMNAGAVLNDNKRYDEAIKIVQEFITRYPDNEMNYNAHMLLADIYANKNQYDQAIDVYKKCLKVFSDDKIKLIDCLYNIGEMERRKGNPREAIRLWKELAEKHPDDVGAQNALISAAEAAETDLKDLRLARDLYQQFLNMNPKDGMKILMVKYKMEMLKSQNRP
jgi:tetratricopeptide (TPR) repeat protein